MQTFTKIDNTHTHIHTHFAKMILWCTTKIYIFALEATLTSNPLRNSVDRTNLNHTEMNNVQWACSTITTSRIPRHVLLAHSKVCAAFQIYAPNTQRISMASTSHEIVMKFELLHKIVWLWMCDDVALI